MWPKHLRSIHLSPQSIQAAPSINHRITIHNQTLPKPGNQARDHSCRIKTTLRSLNRNPATQVQSTSAKSAYKPQPTERLRHKHNVHTHTHNPTQPLPLPPPRTPTPNLRNPLPTLHPPPPNLRLYTRHNAPLPHHQSLPLRLPIHLFPNRLILRSRRHRRYKNASAKSGRGGAIGYLFEGAEDVCHSRGKV